MADTKIKPDELSVSDYLATVTDETRHADAVLLIDRIGAITKQPPVMWYKTIVGFGSYHYRYASGHTGETMKIGLSARKEHLVLYGVIFYDYGTGSLEKLGKYKQGKGCLYIKKLSDVDMDVLEEMIRSAYESPAPSEG